MSESNCVKPTAAWFESALETTASSEQKLLAGVVLLHGGGLDPARRLLHQAIQLEPSPAVHGAALAALGVAANVSGDTQAARAYLTSAHEVDPCSWEACYHLAETHAIDGEDEEALSWLSEALKRDSEGWAAHLVSSNPVLQEFVLLGELEDLPDPPAGPPSQGGPLLPGSAWHLTGAGAQGAMVPWTPGP